MKQESKTYLATVLFVAVIMIALYMGHRAEAAEERNQELTASITEIEQKRQLLQGGYTELQTELTQAYEKIEFLEAEIATTKE